MEHWKCPVDGCDEEIDSPGPVSLNMDIDHHNHVCHPELLNSQTTFVPYGLTIDDVKLLAEMKIRW